MTRRARGLGACALARRGRGRGVGPEVGAAPWRRGARLRPRRGTRLEAGGSGVVGPGRGRV